MILYVTLHSGIILFTVICDEVDRIVPAKPAVPVKKAGLTAMKRTPSAASRLQTTSSTSNSGIEYIVHNFTMHVA